MKRTAEVDHVQGIDLYVDSKPTDSYDYLGTVKVYFVWSGQYHNIRNKLIRKSKKKYPTADGLIFNFRAGGADSADAIKFK